MYFFEKYFTSTWILTTITNLIKQLIFFYYNLFHKISLFYVLIFSILKRKEIDDITRKTGNLAGLIKPKII